MPAYNLLHHACLFCRPKLVIASGKMRLHTLLQKVSQTSAYYATMRNISIGNGWVSQNRGPYFIAAGCNLPRSWKISQIRLHDAHQSLAPQHASQWHLHAHLLLNAYSLLPCCFSAGERGRSGPTIKSSPDLQHESPFLHRPKPMHRLQRHFRCLTHNTYGLIQRS